MEPQVYQYKFAKALRERGYETILFTISEKYKINYDFYNQAFDKIYCSDFEFRGENIKNIKYLLKKGPKLLYFLIKSKLIKPDVVIGLSGINWQVKFARKYFYKKIPFIFFTHDMRSHFFESKKSALKQNLEFEIEAEKYNFENADGIIHKGAPEGLEAIQGRIFNKVKLPKLQLSFEPYCSKEFQVPINKDKLSKKDKELHLVYVGFFWTNQGEAGSHFFNKLLDQKIHLHLYITGIGDDLSKEEKLDYLNDFFPGCKENKYFHIHPTLPPKDLIPEISKYDFGLFPLIPLSKENIEPKFCASNKIASYLEAGLPLITPEELIFLNKTLKSYGLDIIYNDKNIMGLNKRLKKLDYEDLINKLKKMREEYSIEKNINKLQEFIEEVIKNK